MTESIRRHRFLTIWLWLIVIFNILGCIGQLHLSNQIHQTSPMLPLWALWLLSALMLFNIVCAIALFKWKKWGFWGYCAAGVIGAVINIVFSTINPLLVIIAPIISILLLFWALHVGKEQKAWTRLT